MLKRWQKVRLKVPDLEGKIMNILPGPDGEPPNEWYRLTLGEVNKGEGAMWLLLPRDWLEVLDDQAEPE